MGLRSIAAAAARIGFSAAGDTLMEITLLQGPTGSFSPATDTTATTYTHTTPLPAVVWDQEKKAGGDGPPTIHKMIMLKAEDLTGLPAPAENDAVTISGITYNIKLVETDPAGATHIITALK